MEDLETICGNAKKVNGASFLYECKNPEFCYYKASFGYSYFCIVEFEKYKKAQNDKPKTTG